MEVFIVIVAIVAVIVLVFVYSMLFGHGFRQLNEGKKYTNETSDGKSTLKTLAIGLFIFMFIMAMYQTCN
jgi:heme/copper-type cytochrome/quinol oxidase subunit 2